MEISKEAKDIIESNLLFIGSCDKKGNPNVTVVDGVKVISDEKILICDVMMTICKEYLTTNPYCCLLAYDDGKKFGYKIFGNVDYLTKGREFSLAQNILKEQKLKVKGAIVVKVENIFRIK